MKASESIALEIVRDIVNRGLKAGDKLPLEAEMLGLYGVSRPTLREALRLLEVQGLIVIRRGSGAGAVVGEGDPTNLARSAVLYLHLEGVSYPQLLKAWAMSETILAELAARNPARERVREAMRPFLDSSTGCGPHMISEAVNFHDLIAELADNPVMSLMLRSIVRIVTEHVHTTIPRKKVEDWIIDEHQLLARAIYDGDVDRTRELMESHINKVISDFTSYWPKQVGDRVRLI